MKPSRETPLPYCHVCGGAGNFYQDGRCIPCHVCEGKGRAPQAQLDRFDGWGERKPGA